MNEATQQLVGSTRCLKDAYTIISEEAIERLCCFERCRVTAFDASAPAARRREALRSAAGIAGELDGLYFALSAISHAGYDREVARIYMLSGLS